MIDIKNLDKAEVLSELYNFAKPYGKLGKLLYNPNKMTIARARELLDAKNYFDCLSGRIIKVILSSDKEFDERAYDKYNGFGTAQKAIDLIRIRSSL